MSTLQLLLIARVWSHSGRSAVRDSGHIAAAAAMVRSELSATGAMTGLVTTGTMASRFEMSGAAAADESSTVKHNQR